MNFTQQAPVVQRQDNFIRWIRHYSGSKIYFTLNVVQGFGTLPNLIVVGVCIFNQSIKQSINLYLNTVKSIRSIKIRNNLTILNKIQNLTTTNLTKTCFS